MSLLAALILAPVVWGAFAFGAVYPWAYWPLQAAFLLAGVIGLSARPAQVIRRVNAAVALGLAVIILAVLVQLIPLTRPILIYVSPATDGFLTKYELSYAAAALDPTVVRHALSIDPPRTWLGFTFLITLGAFLLGIARGIALQDVRAIARGVVACGAALALVGIVQKATFQGEIYGFWRPELQGDPFGPFVNRNHFAGWMLMALPVALGYLSALSRQQRRLRNAAWHDRVLWLFSPRASEIALVALATFLMALALVLTMSRSGIAGFVLAAPLIGWAVTRRQTRKGPRILVWSYLAILVIFTVGWAGTRAVGARFVATNAHDIGGRLVAWQDALRITRDFPLTGTGLNTYGTATILYQQAHLSEHYAEAHNDYLQLAAEGGALLTLPAILMVAILARETRIRLRDTTRELMSSRIRLGAAMGLMTIGVQEAADFSLQIPGNAAFFAVLCGLVIHDADKVPAESSC